MKQIDFIKQTYASMNDDELIALAQSNGVEFHTAAITALYQEFQQRSLPTNPIASLRTDKINHFMDESSRKETADFEQFSNQVWQRCIELRSNDCSRLDLYRELRESGISDESSLWFLGHFDDYLAWTKKYYEDEKFTGGFITLLSIAAIIFLIANQLFNMALVISIAFGIANLIRYTSSKDRLDRLNNIRLLSDVEAIRML